VSEVVAPVAPAVVDPAAPAVAPVVAPAPAPAPAVETPAAAPETLLGAADKPADPAAVDPAKPVEGDDPPLDYAALNVPDGYDKADPVFNDFLAAAAEHKISPDVAQALVDKVLPGLTAQIEALRTAPAQQIAARNSEWANAVQSDAEIGGSKLNEVKVNVARAMAQYGNPDEIKAALNETGAGSNPAIVRWLSRMGAALSEGTAVTGGRPALGKQDPVSVMYPNTSFNGSVASQ
jgi:hypothetical protein